MNACISNLKQIQSAVEQCIVVKEQSLSQSLVRL